MRSKSLLPSLWGDKRDVFPPFKSLHREIDRVFDEFTRAMPWDEETNGEGLQTFRAAHRYVRDR